MLGNSKNISGPIQNKDNRQNYPAFI